MIRELIEKFQKWFKTKSPAGSLKGFDFWKLFIGNYKTIKEIAKVGLPFALGYAVTNNIITASAATLVGKAALDTLEFWYKKKKV